MRKIKVILISFILVIPFIVPAYGQIRSEGTKFGLQINGLVPDDDFGYNKGIKVNFLARGFLRFDASQNLEVELGGGFGKYSGIDFRSDYYSTDLVPIDLRFVLSPFNVDSWNPFFYFGFGALHYSVKDLPLAYTYQNPLQRDVKKDGWTGIIPAGIGAQFALNQTMLLEISAGVSYSLTENLNYYKINETPYDAYFTLGVGLTFQRNRGMSDDDKDGLTLDEEEALGTDPKKADTDGDGLSDGDEVNKFKTNPLNNDTDGDGLKDNDEIYIYKTNPLKNDTDDDGLLDGEEINIYKTNPNDADTDHDGLTDGEEVKTYKTDPLKADTDKDGLKDGDEVNTYKTNPIVSDTDGDGLKDGDEVVKYKTDPNKKDTDGGTIDDGIEVNRGTNPNDPNDDVVKIGVPIILEGITFESGKYDITPESEVVLQKALKTMETYPDIEVEISGYTDNIGNASRNLTLSQNRAAAVKGWLVSHGVDETRIIAKGYGSDNPIVPNDSRENRRKNRRIEFKRIK